jgi:putative ABC transport system substrate-binding protein
MHRRYFVKAFALVSLWPSITVAETSSAHRIGVLAQDLQPGLLETFRDQLQRLGYAEGKNIDIELRNASGRNELLAGFAEELLGLKVDVIVAINHPPRRQPKKPPPSFRS